MSLRRGIHPVNDSVGLLSSTVYGDEPKIKENKMKDYIRLLRPKHYVKNGLVLVAIIFSGNLLNIHNLFKVGCGVIAFCFISSTIYILNDIMDVESDRKHEVKRNRPIASGKVSIKVAWIISGSVFVLALLANSLIGENANIGFGLLILYFILNVLYSGGLKKVPLLDVAILVSGFLIRVLYGAVIIGQPVSNWLYLTVICMSFYLGLGKRRNELIKKGDNASETRGVLKYYSKTFLDKNMYMCMALTIVFYSLWCVDPIVIDRIGNNSLIWTVPFVLLICMKYSLIIEMETYGDPVDVLLGNKGLIAMVLLYSVVMFGLLYGGILINGL